MRSGSASFRKKTLRQWFMKLRRINPRTAELANAKAFEPCTRTPTTNLIAGEKGTELLDSCCACRGAAPKSEAFSSPHNLGF